MSKKKLILKKEFRHDVTFTEEQLDIFRFGMNAFAAELCEYIKKTKRSAIKENRSDIIPIFEHTKAYLFMIEHAIKQHNELEYGNLNSRLNSWMKAALINADPEMVLEK